MSITRAMLEPFNLSAGSILFLPRDKLTATNKSRYPSSLCAHSLADLRYGVDRHPSKVPLSWWRLCPKLDRSWYLPTTSLDFTTTLQFSFPCWLQTRPYSASSHYNLRKEEILLAKASLSLNTFYCPEGCFGLSPLYFRISINLK